MYEQDMREITLSRLIRSYFSSTRSRQMDSHLFLGARRRVIGKLEPEKILLRVSIIVREKNNVDCIMGASSNSLLMHLIHVRELLTARIRNYSDEYMLFYEENLRLNIYHFSTME